jgi:trk system potassium uptake protein TrkA
MSVARTLYEVGHEVIAIDVRDEIVDRASQFVTRAVVGDGTDVEILKRCGANEADYGVVSTGADITASILSILALQDAGIEDIHVKVISLRHERVVRRIGVDEVVFPERESGQDLARRLMGGGVLHYVHFSERFSLQEMVLPEKWQGRSLRELRIRDEYGVQVVAVHDVLSGQTTIPPNPDAALKISDTLIIAGRDGDLHKLTST